MKIVAVTGAASSITYNQVADILDTYNKGTKIIKIVAGDGLGVERHALAYAANRDLPFREKDFNLMNKWADFEADAIIFILKKAPTHNATEIWETAAFNNIDEIIIHIV